MAEQLASRSKVLIDTSQALKLLFEEHGSGGRDGGGDGGNEGTIHKQGSGRGKRPCSDNGGGGGASKKKTSRTSSSSSSSSQALNVRPRRAAAKNGEARTVRAQVITNLKKDPKKAAAAGLDEIQVMMASPVSKVGPVVAIGVGNGQFELVRMLSAPVRCEKRRYVKATYQWLSKGDYCFKARRLICVDDDRNLYADQHHEEVVLVASVVNTGKDLKLIPAASTDCSTDIDCFELPEEEHKRIADSSLNEFVQKLS